MSGLAGALLICSLAVYPDDAWDKRIDPACCPYPEHDPRDYNWPYSHLQYSEVVPDVLGSFVPMTELNLTYADEAVSYGKPISPRALSRAPSVAYALEPDRTSETLHTLVMVDPDVPFRDAPSEGEWIHWLVYDIPGNRTDEGKTLVEYSPPKPRPCDESDRLCLPEHRITFALWEQERGPLQLHEQDVHITADSDRGRARYQARAGAARRVMCDAGRGSERPIASRQARDFASRHELHLQLAMNFFETWHDAGDGSFGARPWWHVSDTESLAAVGHLLDGRKDPKRGKKDEL